MSSTPERDAPGQQGSAAPRTHAGMPSPEGMSRAGEYSGVPASQAGAAETRVTGRRVVQYLIDSFLVGLIPGLVSIPFDRSTSTVVHIVGGLISFAVFVLIGLAYWVVWAHAQHGQTPGMKLLRLRVISKGGGPANLAQLFIRWICLIFDAIPYAWPVTGLVGFIVILASRDRQRIGDHLARTLVVRADSPTRLQNPRGRPISAAASSVAVT